MEGRKKTCPCCRGVVEGRPVLVWGVKDLVAAVRKSGLAGAGAISEPVEPEAGDPWERIFYKKGAGPGLGLGGGGPLGFGMEGPLGMGFLDEEDGGVFRCYDCMHEIWDGVCSHCGRLYHDEDEDDLDPDELDDDDDGYGANGDLFRILHRIGADRGEDVDEEYEDSFIDDDEVEGELRQDQQPDSVIDIDLLSDSESSPQARNLGRGARIGRESSSPIQIDSGDEDVDSGDDVRPSILGRRFGRKKPVVVISSDEEEEEEDNIDP